MENASAWDWLQARFFHAVGQQLSDASLVIPAPVWFEEGDRVGAGIRWYGVVITFPRRPTIGEAGFIPGVLKPVAGFADDFISARSPADLVAATDRLWVHTLQQFGVGGGTTVMPAFFGRDP